jgi:uncharacterized protein YgbK (DUF1537 family)
MNHAKPARLDVAFYGDDFTGSTDALEVLASSGIETALFLRLPEPAWLERFAHCRALGVAGVSRSQTPEWMDAHLPPVFRWLKSTNARLCHYKVCSTFDSSPQTGSIGRAIDIGRNVFDVPYVPVAVGAPALRRYTAFGNLFATVGSETFRIDRHPTMSRHPVTPMNEADLRVHLGRQTEKRIALLDVLALWSGEAEQRLHELLADGPEIVLFDIFDDASLREVGRLLWLQSEANQTFAAGSSGVEYALVAHWRREGVLPEAPAFGPLQPVDRLAVLSGSCSPVTEKQIRWAQANGFSGIHVDAAALVAGDARNAAIDRIIESAWSELCSGSSVILYTAGGAHDRVEMGSADRETLARLSGAIFDQVLKRTGVRRAVVAGGDTSSHAGQQLGLYALTFRTPMAPGAPICCGYSDDRERDGLEIVFKGGQCGRDSFFESVRQGSAIQSPEGE